MDPRRTPHRRWAAVGTAAIAAIVGVGAATAAWTRTSSPDTGVPPPREAAAPSTSSAPPPLAPLPGAMTGLDLAGLDDEPLRSQLIAAADEELDRQASPRQPFEAESVDDPFVDDALAAYTLALAGRATGDDRYDAAAARILDAWVSTVTSTEGTCPDTGGCQTSLVLSRAAPALIYASNLLDSAGKRSDGELTRFRAWIRDIALPAASRRDNNWGDAGTYLRVVAAVELEDRAEFDAAIEQWRRGVDLIAADGHIPEETRRDKAGLLYSQEALSYKVAVAELAARQGVDLWDVVSVSGASLHDALALTARSIREPAEWRWHDQPRVPSPAPMWALVAQRWPDENDFTALASAALARNGNGHSGVVWTAAMTSP